MILIRLKKYCWCKHSCCLFCACVLFVCVERKHLHALHNVSSVRLVLTIVQLGTKQSMNILKMLPVSCNSCLQPLAARLCVSVPQAFSCHPPLRKRERSRVCCWALMRWPPGPNMKQMWKGRPPPNLPPSTTTRSEPSAEGAQLTGATSGWCLKHLFKRCQCRTTQEKNTRIGLYVHVQKWKQVWHDSFLGCAAVRDELDIHDRIVLCN